MKPMEPRAERRQTVISDSDVERIGERIGEAFDQKIERLFEMIGYDTTSAEARGEIRKDHEFVRDARKARAIVMTAILASIGGGVAVALWAGAKVLAATH